MEQLVKFLILFLAIAFLGYQVLEADSVDTPESATVQHVATALRIFERLNENKSAKNWRDLSSVFDLDRNSAGMLTRQGYRIDERYVFLENPVPFSETDSGEIILMRVTPLSRQSNNEETLYRYFIYRSGSAEIQARQSSEEKLQAIFKEAGVPLPKVEGLPAWESESSPQSAPASPPVATTPPQLEVSKISPEPSQKSAAEVKSTTDFPIWSVAILGGLIVAVVVFLVRRRSS